MYFQNGKKMEIFMDSEKSMNSFEIKMDRLLHYLHGSFFYQFVNKFLAILLCRINFSEIFNSVDFF